MRRFRQKKQRFENTSSLTAGNKFASNVLKVIIMAADTTLSAIATILFIIVCSSQAQSEVYRWVDEGGVTHFGNRPPPGEYQKVQIKDANSSAAPSRQLTETLTRSRNEREYRKTNTADRPDYVCRGATNRATNAVERWEAAKKQGYTQAQKQRHEQRIKEAERHRDNICR